MNRLAYSPAVETADQLTDIVSRAAWFLTFSPIEKIYVPIADPALAEAPWQVAPGMDPAIAARFDALRRLVEFVPVRGRRDLKRVLSRADAVLCWRSGEDADPELGRRLSRRTVFEVDPHGVRMEGANYINVSYRLGPSTREMRAEHEARFARIARGLGEFERAFLLATGPSVGEYRNFDYQGSLGIVCNTVVLDEELMSTVRPEFVVFCDPIFHFGPSQYAAEFRAKVRQAAQRFDFTICLPAKYFWVWAAAAPELAERTVAIPFQMERAFNFDLRAEFEVATTSNVLTFVMLPLATTFAKRISILGCDGRPLTDDGYFWKHNPATQLTEQMANVRAVHPGFFNLDYNDYYLEHCDRLERLMREGEPAGYRFETLAESHIPALKRRTPTSPADHQPAERARVAEPRERRPPRLLMIDATRVSGRTATGQLKRNFLAGWQDSYFRQLWAFGGTELRLARSLDDPSGDLIVSPEEAIDEVAAFEPEVIYYRPTIDKHPELHRLALEVLERYPVPLVTQIMDDWPQRLAATDPAAAEGVDRSLREVLARSDKLLSISEKMSRVFKERYGMDFEPISNGVDRETYIEASRAAKQRKQGRGEVVLRYCGALAEDMTFDTMVDVARAVDALQGELAIRFEVYTMPIWRPPFEQAIAGLSGTKVENGVFGEGFPALLAEADILVLGYNFDTRTSQYVGLSVPNKLPEYLASGAAVLAVGPMDINGIEYVVSRGLACSVAERSDEQLVAALRRLATDGRYREELAEKAQTWVFEHLDLARISARFQAIMREAVDRRTDTPLLGPFSRDQGARVDEGEVIARLIDPASRRGTLLDVGAHRGTSSARYAEAGWKVVACEPDDANRTVLARRFRRNKNVSIDPRAVSDAPAAATQFYSSDESTGISSLHAFHETHQASQTVEVTTVAELVEAHDLEKIDLLKIDVEGLDWKVLKGVPWDRVQPEAIECEFEDRKTASLGYRYTDMADDLVAKGYVVYLSEWHPIVRYGIPHQWRQVSRYPASLGSDDAWGNLLAFKTDPGPTAVAEAFAAEVVVEEASPVVEPPPPPAAVEEPVAAAAEPEAPATRGLGERLRARGSWSPSHPIMVLGRLAVWVARRARSHPGPAAAYVLALAALTAAGFVPELDPYGKLGWLAAGLMALLGVLLAGVGFANFLVGELRGQMRLQQRDLRRRFERDEDQLRSAHSARKRLEQRVDGFGAIERRVEELGGLEQRVDEFGAIERRVEELGGLERRVDAFGGLEQQRVEALGGLERRVEALDRRLAEAAGPEPQPAAPDERLSGYGLRLSRLEEAQRAQQDRAEADRRALEAEQRAASAALGVRLGALETRLKELAETLARRRDEREASEVRALQRRISELEAAQAKAVEDLGRRRGADEDARRRVLERRITKLENAQARTAKDLSRGLGKGGSADPSPPLRRYVSLQVARSNAGAEFDGLVLVVAPQRSGSTWLLDLLRCHPGAVLLPTAEVYRRLAIRGRRYPPDLSDGPDAALSIEAARGVGAEIPAFQAAGIAADSHPRLAVERVHPSAISFDSSKFLERLQRLEESAGKSVRLCYLTRDPVESIRSFRAYRSRAPQIQAPDAELAVPELYRRSFVVLNELAASRPGPVVRYEELVDDPVTVLSELYRRLWPATGSDETVSIATAAVDLTRRDKRQATQSGRFLATASDRNGGSEATNTDDDEAIPECRRLSRRLGELHRT